MKLFILLMATLIASQGFSQLFSSQLANENAAYTGMMDNRFSDISYSGLYSRQFFEYTSLSTSYQQNLEKLNSGIGLNLGYSRTGFDDYKSTTNFLALNYRYAHSFENGLKLAAAARFGIGKLRVPYLEEYPDFTGINDTRFGISLGSMAMYKKLTIGFSTPIVGSKVGDWWNINSSYSAAITNKIEITTLLSSAFGRGMFRSQLSIRSDFNRKFWFSTSVTFSKNGNFSNAYSNLNFGVIFKKNFNAYAGTGFSFSRTSFSLFNPTLGLIYRLR